MRTLHRTLHCTLETNAATAGMTHVSLLAFVSFVYKPGMVLCRLLSFFALLSLGKAHTGHVEVGTPTRAATEERQDRGAGRWGGELSAVGRS